MRSSFILMVLACLIGCGGGGALPPSNPPTTCAANCTPLTTQMFADGQITLPNVLATYTNPDSNPAQVSITCSADLLLIQDPTTSTAGIGWVFGLETSPDNSTWTTVGNNHVQFGTQYANGEISSEQMPTFTAMATVPGGGILYARLVSRFVDELGGPGQFPSGTLTVKSGSIQIK